MNRNLFNKKRSKNIYFAATPIHLIGIKEFIKKNNIKEFELILFLHNTKKPDNEIALKQIFLTLKILNFKKYEIFWMPKIRIIRFFLEILLIIKLKKRSIGNNLNFIIFDFRNIFLQSLRRYFKNSEFTLIDDGFYTYVAEENYMQKNLFLPVEKYKSLEGRISKLLYFGFSFKRLKKTPLKIFTIYADEISNPNAEMNNLNYLKNKTIKSNGKIIDKIVYFTGTGMVERGALKLEQELSLIKAANKYWKEKGKIMYYVGKRSTSRRKLNVFEDNGINTLKFDLPLELVFSEEKIIPGNICSLGSTLQKSLSILFDNKINFYFIKLKDFFNLKNEDCKTIKMDEVDQIAALYSEKSSNIITINLH